MKKIIVVLIFLLLLNIASCEKVNEEENQIGQVDNSISNQRLVLSKKQMIADYDYLWDTLEANYPYFDAMERQGIKWKTWKEYYRGQVENCTRESEFYSTINKTLLMMDGFAHLDFIGLDYFYNFYDNYEQASKRGERKHIFSKLEQAKPYYDQWANIMRHNRANRVNRMEVMNVKTISEVQFYEEENAAYIKIDSFDSRSVESDYERIREFYDKAVNYDNIIIDISHNGGGSTQYWKQNIVELLLNETAINSHYLLYKLGENNIEHLKDIYGEVLISSFKEIKELSINDAMPPEVIARKFDAFIEINRKYDPDPKEGYYYKGRIWVLIDRPVYSATDGFALFCKNTGFATLVGRTTGGDGIGIDPALIILPSSGLVIRYSASYGLDSSGASNVEVGTIPDIISPKGEEPLETCLKAILGNN